MNRSDRRFPHTMCPALKKMDRSAPTIKTPAVVSAITGVFCKRRQTSFLRHNFHFNIRIAQGTDTQRAISFISNIRLRAGRSIKAPVFYMAFPYGITWRNTRKSRRLQQLHLRHVFLFCLYLLAQQPVLAKYQRNALVNGGKLPLRTIKAGALQRKFCLTRQKCSTCLMQKRDLQCIRLRQICAIFQCHAILHAAFPSKSSFTPGILWRRRA